MAEHNESIIQSDHDLLIVLNTKLDYMMLSLSGKAEQREVSELRERVKTLESDSQTAKGNWKLMTGAWLAVTALLEIGLHVAKVFGH